MRIKLGFPLTEREIAACVGGIAHNDNTIEYITTDSREVMRGDLFIALDGEKYNGENYVCDVIKKGAIPMSQASRNVGITVYNTREALLLLAGCYIKRLKNLKHRIAITGSVGKTTTKEFMRVILAEEYKIHASHENYNNEIGMPLSILSAYDDTEVLVCELGMNHSGEIRRMANILLPEIAVITNIGSSHIGNLGSREAIAKAKLEITENTANKVTLVPTDERLLSSAKNKITFSLNDHGSNFTLLVRKDNYITIYKNGEPILSERFAFRDTHLYTSLLISIAVATLTGESIANIKRGVIKISAENIRQKMIFGKRFNFCADFYNSSPESLFAALDSLMRLDNFASKSALIGDILELGDFAESIHYEIGRRLCKYNLHRLYLFGPLSINTLKGAVDSGFPLERIFINDNIDSPHITVDQIKQNSNSNEIILMKASRALKLERILEYFTNDDMN